MRAEDVLRPGARRHLLLGRTPHRGLYDRIVQVSATIKLSGAMTEASRPAPALRLAAARYPPTRDARSGPRAGPSP